MSAEKQETQRFLTGWFNCQAAGHHFFRRDYIFGLIPIGRPYCMWCGAERRAASSDGTQT